MGCVSSTPVKEDDYRDQNRLDFDKKLKIPANVEAVLTQGQRRNVSFAGDVRDTPTNNHNNSAGGADAPSRAVSISGRPSRTSVQKREKSFVGADLHAIMDDHGMLNPLVSRQLSVMSHYSVRSESGSVMITPEQAEAPFKLIRLIGRGGFGNVYLGDWEGERVAIKVIAGNTNSEQPEEQEWEARKERMAQMEAILMSAINHDNIVRTYKVTAHSGDTMDPDLLTVERQLLAGAGGDPESGVPSFEWHIIMEYCDKGSLSKALASFKFHEPIDNQTIKWDAWASLETLKEVVSALQFLHEHKILHGDLKAANVLLASCDVDPRGFTAKVSDFGLSRVLKDKNHIKTQTFGTVTHMPPELLAKGTLSPSSDVYAVGVLMWEIFTGEKVFKQLSDSEVILAVVTKKARPTFPSDCPSKFKFLAEKCWAEMPEIRPSLENLYNELESLQRNLCPQGEESSRIACKVYPTRQRPLEQYRAQLAAQAAAQAAGGSTGGSTPKPPTAPSPTAQHKSQHRSRKSQGEKGASPLGRESGHTQSYSTAPMPNSGSEMVPRTKSFAAPGVGRSPLSNASGPNGAARPVSLQNRANSSSGAAQQPASPRGAASPSPLGR